MRNFPATVRIALAFFGVNILIWFGFAVLVLAGAHPALPRDPAVRGILAALAFAAAAGLSLAVFLLAKRLRFGYCLSVAALGLLAILTFADDVGPADWIYLVLVLIPLILLVRDRGWYLAGPEPPGNRG
jgi:hypothetical protein